ncbi:MAG: DNA repair protein RecO [Betaproteobacteria bacterium]|nr:DNA repair protein RecO [Betaproteobacteria bacterium]
MTEHDKARQDSQPAYLLHSYPYRETSLVIETFTRNRGRVALVARGARRPRSALRGVLLAFQPLTISWSGRSELRTLHKAEWQGGLPQLKGEALLCGFYLNELLLKLVARDDAHEALFEAYDQTLHALAEGQPHDATLRRFELRLLKELGYAPSLDNEGHSGKPIVAAGRYHYWIESGPVRAGEGDDDGGQNRLELSGQTLLDMAQDLYENPQTLQQSKALMRMLINHYLGNQMLNTRQLLKDLQQL